MPVVDSYADADLPAHLGWQVMACMRENWPDLFRGAMTWATRPYPAAAEPHHLMIHHDDVLIAYAAVIRADVRHEGAPYAVGGLGNVLTASPYRRQGHGARLLAAVNVYLDGAGFDAAALFCRPDLAGFYARAGWMSCPGGTVVGTALRGPPYPELRMMRFLSARGRAAQASFVDRPMLVASAW